jgi:hypothetical protein
MVIVMDGWISSLCAGVGALSLFNAVILYQNRSAHLLLVWSALVQLDGKSHGTMDMLIATLFLIKSMAWKKRNSRCGIFSRSKRFCFLIRHIVTSWQPLVLYVYFVLEYLRVCSVQRSKSQDDGEKKTPRWGWEFSFFGIFGSANLP